MMGSLFAGVSGLKNHQTQMDVISNNIANVNTIGFKSGRVNFQEALVQTYKGAGRPSAITGGTNPQQLGLGMQVSSIDTLYTQGGLETTGQITDLAIQGSGYFILGDGYGNSFYTRAGAFGFDANSTLVDLSSGLFVMGKMADNSGVISSMATIDQIQLPFGQQDPARATEEITVANNLDASATDSLATLISSGGSNITAVNGTAADGVGGQHVISITGAQPISSTVTGANVGNDGSGNPVGALSGSMTLTSLGIDDFTNFGFSIDGGSMEYISGLNGDSTVDDVISAINQIDGMSAELTGGEILLTRTKAGSGTDYNVTSTVGTYSTGAGGGATSGNIVGVLFGVNGTTIQADNGVATTFVATDTFTPERGYGAAAGPETTILDLVFDDTTGLVVGLDGLGDDGVEMKAGAGGLQATAGDNLIVNTALTTHSTSINVYDSLGARHTLVIEFSKSLVDNRWEWEVSTLDGEAVSAGQYGYVSFNPDGSLNTFEYSGGASAIVIEPNNGAESMRIAVDAGTNSNFDGLTGFASGNHTATIVAQDGYGMGILESISIDTSGNISGIFSNGVTRVLAQIYLADFNNQAGLVKAGESLFQTSANSGEAVEGVAGETISAEITSGALESSTVDIAQEFTNMIITQRGYQANARIITTSDEMLDQLVNLKR
ncbi:MAG: flagellar hook-basal body complex protein [Candidatus Zixiibacteriota bacterium]